MSFENDKLTKFTTTILNDAKISSDNILEELASEREKRLSVAKARMTCEFERYISRNQEKISSDLGTAISKHIQDNKRQLALRRDMISSSILKDVEAEIVAFTKSDKYISFLEKQLKDALNLIADDGPFILLANSADIDYLKKLAENFKALEGAVYMPLELNLGGFILSDITQSKHANMTLDLAFKELSDHVFEYMDLS